MRLGRLFGLCIILSLMILVFSSSPAKSEIKVYDADNQYLGIFLFGEDYLAVHNTDKVLILETDESISPSGKYADIQEFETVYYKKFGCSGTPYVYSGEGYYTNIVGKIPCDDKVYRADTNRTAVFKSVSRRLKSNCTCENTYGTSDAFYLELVPDNLPFSTPIKVPYRFEHVDPAVTPKAKVVVIPLGD